MKGTNTTVTVVLVKIQKQEIVQQRSYLRKERMERTEQYKVTVTVNNVEPESTTIRRRAD